MEQYVRSVEKGTVWDRTVGRKGGHRREGGRYQGIREEVIMEMYDC